MSQSCPYPTTGGPTLPVDSLELSRRAANRYAQLSAVRAVAEPKPALRLRRRRTATRPA